MEIGHINLESDASMAMDVICSKAGENIKPEQGDYYVDGLLFCGKCKTAKQLKVQMFGRTKTPMCLCKCAAERKQAKAEAQEHEERLRDIMRMRRAGFPDAVMMDWCFDRDDGDNPDASNACKKYVELFDRFRRDGNGLLLYGSVGTGKTFLAACITNALVDRHIPCLMTNFPRLVNTIQGRRDDRQEYIDSLDDYELLVIDDLASERNTEFMSEIVQNIIDSRYRSGLPLIITTNLSLDELGKSTDLTKQRTYSRIMEMCIPVEVRGSDRRRKKAKNKIERNKELLGL